MHPLIREVHKKQQKRVPEVKTGYTIRVHQKIKEGNKERIQVFEGLVIKMGHGTGTEKTMTVRKIVQGIGVEKIFPIHSPNITKIEVKKKAKVRRAKLYYMRERSGKSARLQERHVTAQERAEEQAKMEALIEEAVKADEKRKAEEVKASCETNQPDTEKPTGDAVGDSHAGLEQGRKVRPEDEKKEEQPTDETPAEGSELAETAEEKPTDSKPEEEVKPEEVPAKKGEPAEPTKEEEPKADEAPTEVDEDKEKEPA